MADMEKLFRARSVLPHGKRGGHWQPAADIYRTKEGWVVKLDLAGVEPDDLTVSIVDSRLVVRGTRRDRTLCEGMWHYQMEITYSRFERVISLPCDLSSARVETDYQNGLLLITFHTDRTCEQEETGVKKDE